MARAGAASIIRNVSDAMRNTHRNAHGSERERERKRPPGVQALERACRLLIQVISTDEPLSVGQLARATGLHQSTTSRLLASLERYELVERERPRGRVRIGPALTGFSQNRLSRPALLKAGRPILDELALRTGETINLAVPLPHGVDHIAQVDAPHVLVTTNWVGRPVPLHCSSIGKLFLAFGAVELDGEELDRYTPATITDRDRLAAELAVIRRRGFATLMDELEPGLRAVAVPVRAGDGRVVAALALSGPSVRLPRRRLHAYVEDLVRAASLLGSQLPAQP